MAGHVLAVLIFFVGDFCSMEYRGRCLTSVYIFSPAVGGDHRLKRSRFPILGVAGGGYVIGQGAGRERQRAHGTQAQHGGKQGFQFFHWLSSSVS